MFIITIDCGTTNTQICVVNKNGDIIGSIDKKIGVRDGVISGNKDVLKQGINNLLYEIINKTKLKERDIYFIISSGMITSEIGLVEIPHLCAPCNIEKLSQTITKYNKGVISLDIPIYFVRGIKNCPNLPKKSLEALGHMDFMRGEETQVAGLLEVQNIKPPLYVVVLSSHTKFIAIDKEKNIIGSITTLSGQLYESLYKETTIGKSMQKSDDYNDNNDENYLDLDMINYACEEVIRYGLLRTLMYARFLDTLIHRPWYECRLFVESVLACDDIRAFDKVKELAHFTNAKFVIIGKPRRCKIYEHLIRKAQKSLIEIIIIDNKEEINKLSVKGMFILAKKAGLF